MYNIRIERTYFPKGTNGIITYKGKEICKCVELPWFDNRPRLSCIPEGFYTVFINYTEKDSHHLYIPWVPERNYIVIHAVNLAVRELQGCIAPVIRHTGAGMGVNSEEAMKILMDAVYDDIIAGEQVNLIISSKHGMDECAIPGAKKAGTAGVSTHRAAEGG